MVPNSSQPVQKCDSTSCRVFVRRADVKKIPTITYSYAWSITGKQTPERTVVKTTIHYPEWITSYIKNKHVTHQLYIYAFVLIITDLSVEHLNLFVVVECILDCSIRGIFFVTFF